MKVINGVATGNEALCVIDPSRVLAAPLLIVAIDHGRTMDSEKV